MSDTKRWYYSFLDYNSYWYRHEIKEIRIALHRSYRRYNKFLLKKLRDIEIEKRTCGWISW